MSKKVLPLPLRLKRPEGYVPELPEDYKPSKSKSVPKIK